MPSHGLNFRFSTIFHDKSATFTKERNISYFFPRRNKRRYKLARLQLVLNRFSAWKPLTCITFFLDSYREKTIPSPKCIYERIDLSRNRLSPPKTGPLLLVSIETLNWRDCVRKICQRRDPRREISNVYDFSDSPVENTGEWKTRNSWEISSPDWIPEISLERGTFPCFSFPSPSIAIWKNLGYQHDSKFGCSRSSNSRRESVIKMFAERHRVNRSGSPRWKRKITRARGDESWIDSGSKIRVGPPGSLEELIRGQKLESFRDVVVASDRVWKDTVPPLYRRH